MNSFRNFRIIEGNSTIRSLCSNYSNSELNWSESSRDAYTVVWEIITGVNYPSNIQRNCELSSLMSSSEKAILCLPALGLLTGNDNQFFILADTLVGHPENYLFLLLRWIFVGLKYLKHIKFNFEHKITNDNISYHWLGVVHVRLELQDLDWQWGRVLL